MNEDPTPGRGGGKAFVRVLGQLGTTGLARQGWVCTTLPSTRVPTNLLPYSTHGMLQPFRHHLLETKSFRNKFGLHFGIMTLCGNED